MKAFKRLPLDSKFHKGSLVPDPEKIRPLLGACLAPNRGRPSIEHRPESYLRPRLLDCLFCCSISLSSALFSHSIMTVHSSSSCGCWSYIPPGHGRAANFVALQSWYSLRDSGTSWIVRLAAQDSIRRRKRFFPPRAPRRPLGAPGGWRSPYRCPRQTSRPSARGWPFGWPSPGPRRCEGRCLRGSA